MNLQVLKKKGVTLILLFCVTISLGSIGVSAKSLEDSFKGWADIVGAGTAKTGASYYRKYAYAQTRGYYKKHYVRSMIGKGKNDPDSKRIWSNGNVRAECHTVKIICDGGPWNFKTAYAYYGH
ncbi:hypothetical protein [Lachnobacterium bovis]|jgi:hypothetical protein|uniref:Bacteriocin (Lactococcin_972) n=1 Tax=Lachnobacterium bovis DSM 14045 TaxID=1122142 RepID=A0A1H3KRJ9_9FIRM|nr:hypothetical protein [Lachnobacterium bovis]SDY54797.1 hypothetical protein SAMN02910414_01812 [Lachnobacterium bovis DSM 14045]